MPYFMCELKRIFPLHVFVFTIYMFLRLSLYLASPVKLSFTIISLLAIARKA